MTKEKALFIDRDGTINNDTGHYYVHKKEDFVFNNGVFNLLREAQKAGYLLILISNQGGVAKGEYTREEVEKLHVHMCHELAKEKIHFDALYFCPHHDKIQKCLCRKPLSLMVEKAMARFNIDPKQSFFIGDSARDVQAANRAGVKPIRIEVNEFDFELKL